MRSLFNFSGLHQAFLEAISRHEPTLAFTLIEGVGRFSFLLFLTTDSAGKIKWGDLELFILLARTQKMLHFKLLGNHKTAGDFKVYFTPEDEDSIRKELDILGSLGGPAFDLDGFLNRLNMMIPSSIPLSAKIEVMNLHSGVIRQHCAKYIDSASKVYLLRAGPGRSVREGDRVKKLCANCIC